MARRADSQDSFFVFFVPTMRNLTLFPPPPPSTGRTENVSPPVRVRFELVLYVPTIRTVPVYVKRRKVETRDCSREWRNSSTFGRVKYFLFTFFYDQQILPASRKPRDGRTFAKTRFGAQLFRFGFYYAYTPDERNPCRTNIAATRRSVDTRP